MTTDEKRQQEYYASTAHAYDAMHVFANDEHTLALHILSSLVDFYEIRSVLDVGAGTGRTLLWMRQRHPDLLIRGIEPVPELREQAYRKGVPREELVEGTGNALPFGDNSFDLVCEFAVLHHVAQPRRMIREMTRVASRMLAISDCNFMAQGHPLLRHLKRALFELGLWPFANHVKTRGKGYTLSADDGLAYSYTVFQDLATLREAWQTVRMIAIRGDQSGPVHPKLTADQFLVIGIDKRSRDGSL